MIYGRNFLLPFLGLISLVGVALLADPSHAESKPIETLVIDPSSEQSQGTETESLPETGRTTGLEIPRFVSLKATKAYVRRGPGKSFPIDWVYVRKDMPVEIIDEWELWRRVRDIDGSRGWIHKQLLDGRRHIMVTELIELTEVPDTSSKVVALLEGGVIARLTQCQLNWCKIKAEALTGWLPKSALWGAYKNEVFE